MCTKYKILHQTDLGYVALCEKCDHLHVEIGNFMSVLCKHSFNMILKDFQKVNKRKKELSISTPTGIKTITRLSDNMFLSQTPEEFEKTLKMFEVSNHMMSACEILNHE